MQAGPGHQPEGTVAPSGERERMASEGPLRALPSYSQKSRRIAGGCIATHASPGPLPAVNCSSSGIRRAARGVPPAMATASGSIQENSRGPHKINKTGRQGPRRLRGRLRERGLSLGEVQIGGEC